MPFQYRLEFRRPDGTGVSVPVAPDFAPAVECCRWAAVQRELLDAGAPAKGCSIEPVWAAAGPPYVDGLRIGLQTAQGPFQHTIPTGCISALAPNLRARLIAAGRLEEDLEVTVAISAWPTDEQPRPLPCGELAVEVPFRHASLRALHLRSCPVGPQAGADMPVFVPAAVLAEVASAARQATPLETGGVLLGHLHRSEGVVFVEVTAAVPAIEAVGSEVDLRFTPAAWAAVRTAVDLRKEGELIVGWHHSHPVRSTAFGKCATCAPERQARCEIATALYSSMDRLLHRTVFPRFFSVGIVANDLTEGVVFSMFGWRDGIIAQRGFYEMQLHEIQPGERKT